MPGPAEATVSAMRLILALGVLAAILSGAAPSLAQQLSAAEATALRKQVQQCWTLPAIARTVEMLPVQVSVRLAGDGSLAAVPQIVGGKMLLSQGRGPYFDLAESAQRAILACAPFRLPAQKYPAWSEMQVVFNPRVASPCYLCTSCHTQDNFSDQGVCGQDKGRVDISFGGAVATSRGM